MYTDVIADMLTRIRNASAVRKRLVEMPTSRMKEGIAQVLLDQGFILNYKVIPNEELGQGTLKIALKYDRMTREPAITRIDRISRPGLRQYRGLMELPRVRNGLGVAIISTSKGIMTDKSARVQGVGGEVICYVY